MDAGVPGGQDPVAGSQGEGFSTPVGDDAPGAGDDGRQGEEVIGPHGRFRDQVDVAVRLEYANQD